MLRFISDLSLGILAFSLILAPLAAAASNEPPLVIGIDADMSGGSARSGLAIQRGAEIAISEINTRGGVLGRPLELLTLDHRGNPERGAENIKKFAKTKNLIGLLAGLHTPVALHELKLVHKHELIFLVPWAAGTQVVDNGFSPNFVFRVSVRDQYAGEFLVNRALKEGHKRLGLLLENTGWGRSNEKAMRAALGRAGLVPAGVSWFHWGAHNMHRTLRDLIDQKIDAVILVANAPEGTKVVHAMSSLPKPDRRPIISHWGIAGGSFFETIQDVRSNIDLRVLQTFSFIYPTFPERAKPVIEAYLARYTDAQTALDIFAPVGTAHAYDLVHLLAVAVEQAQSTNSLAVRIALENLPPHRGLIRDYTPAFTSNNHDALTSDDFNISRFDVDGTIVPIR